jgi:hypothetical protein
MHGGTYLLHRSEEFILAHVVIAGMAAEVVIVLGLTAPLHKIPASQYGTLIGVSTAGARVVCLDLPVNELTIAF